MSNLSKTSVPSEFNVNPNDVQEEESDPDEERDGDLIDLRGDKKDKGGSLEDDEPKNVDLAEGNYQG